MTYAADGCLVISVTDALHARAAEGVRSRLERQEDEEWQDAARYVSDLTGTIVIEEPPRPGTYRLQFDIENYFALTGISSALPQGMVVFRVPDAAGHWRLEIFITASTQFVAFFKVT